MPTSSGAEPFEVEGVVRWYDPNRGYGFVASPYAGVKEDIFLHHRNLPEDQRGQRWESGTRAVFKVRINPRTTKPEAFEARIERMTNGR